MLDRYLLLLDSAANFVKQPQEAQEREKAQEG